MTEQSSPGGIPESSEGILLEETKNSRLYRCPCCTGTWTVYKIHFSATHVRILEKLFKYCVTHKKSVIIKSEIPGLTPTDYCNFPFLQRFGLVYKFRDADGKTVRGKWGVPVKRIRQFLAGDWKVAEYSEKDTRTKEQRVSETRITIREIKRYLKKYEEVDRPAWLPYFVSYDSDPFDVNREGFHVSK